MSSSTGCVASGRAARVLLAPGGGAATWLPWWWMCVVSVRVAFGDAVEAGLPSATRVEAWRFAGRR